LRKATVTYPQIRDELRALSARAKQEVLSPEDLSRARTLVGILPTMGIAPRRVRLSLRQLGLSVRQQQRQNFDPTS
jgi:hypothetical protein